MRDQLEQWKALKIDFTLPVTPDSRRAERQPRVIRDLAEMI